LKTELLDIVCCTKREHSDHSLPLCASESFVTC